MTFIEHLREDHWFKALVLFCVVGFIWLGYALWKGPHPCARMCDDWTQVNDVQMCARWSSALRTPNRCAAWRADPNREEW